MSPTPRRILIAGASGVVGQAALAHFEGLPDTEVLALCRRPPKLQSARHLAADLADANVVDALAALPPVTHLI